MENKHRYTHACADNAGELLPVVNELGEVTGAATRGECHGGSMLLHPVVHLHVLDAEGHLYLQKRPQWKDIQPGRWDTAVGGHVDYGEDVAAALVREAREEIGLECRDAQFIGSYIFQSDRERELVNIFAICVDRTDAVTPSRELDGGRFWSHREIAGRIGRGVFTPNFEHEYLKIRETLKKIHRRQPF